MKKTLSLILAAVMIAAALLTFASCGKAGSGKVKVIDIALSEEAGKLCRTAKGSLFEGAVAAGD